MLLVKQCECEQSGGGGGAAAASASATAKKCRNRMDFIQSLVLYPGLQKCLGLGGNIDLHADCFGFVRGIGTSFDSLTFQPDLYS